MATTTPNYGWPVPTSTDLVKNGATAIEALGDAIDASIAELKGGTTGQVLSKTSNTDMDFTWVAQDDSNAIQNTIVDAKGDLIAASAADTPARLGVGTNGQVLTADSTAATGLAWATPASGFTNPMTTTGDIIYSSPGSTPVRRGIGSTGQVLTVAGGVPTWATPASGGANIAGAYATVATQESTSSGSFTDLTTSGPAVTVTTGTRALVVFGASMRSTISGANAQMSFAVSGATTRAVQTNEYANTAFGTGTLNGINVTAEASIIVTGLTAGSNTFTAKYAMPGGDTGSFQYRKITVIDLGS